MRRLLCVLALSSVALTSGCLFHIKRDPKVEAADLQQKGDLATLEARCKSSGVSYSAYCESASDLRYAHFAAETDCDAIEAAINGGAGPFVTDRFGAGYENYRVVATDKALGCKKPELLFTKLIWPMNTKQPAAEALREAQKLGVDVSALMLSWLRQNPAPFDREGGSLVVEGLRPWLLKEQTPSCDALLPYVSKTEKESVRWQWFFYYKDSKCVAAVPVLSEALLSKDTTTRVSACNALGELGDASVIEKLRTLGATDGVWSTNNQGVKYYPVRDACMAAAGKVALRHG